MINLMKGLKWTYMPYWFSLPLVLSVVMPFLFCTANTNALKHEFDTLPLYDLYYSVDDSTSYTLLPHPSFELRFPSGSVPSFDLSKTKAPKIFTSRLSGSKCTFYNSSSWYSSSGNWVASSDGFGIYTPSIIGYSSPLSSVSDSFCNTLSPFGSEGIPQFDRSSFEHTSVVGVFPQLLPYRFNYSSYIQRGEFEESGIQFQSNGGLFDNVLGSSNISLIHDISSVTIPLGVVSDFSSNSPDFIPLTSGTSLMFDFSFTLVDNSALSVASDSVAYLYYRGFDSSDVFYQSTSVPCSISSDVHDSMSANVDISCNFVAPADFSDGLLGFSLVWSSGSSGSLFSASDLSVFGLSAGSDSLYVVSNYDYTPGSSIGSQLVGSDTTEAPGYPYTGDDGDIDWFSSLTNLFHFSASNPFNPLFSSFSDNNSCVSIPVLASWLHTDQSTYCPWFPSSVRSVLTPIFSISSVMLVFGFFVRWLGSSSGNFFEDSTDETLTKSGGSWSRSKKG